MQECTANLRRVLCIDIGADSQSVLFHQSGTNLADMTRLVLPAPSTILSRRIAEATTQRRDIFFAGSGMGGEFLPALSQHVRQGCRVAMDERTAAFIYSSPEDAKSAGMDILSACPDGYLFLPSDEVDRAFWQGVCRALAMEEPPITALSALDTGKGQHYGNDGYTGGMWYWRQLLVKHAETGAPPEAFLLASAPEEMPRLAAIQMAGGALVTDTGIAALLGLLADQTVFERSFRQGVTLVYMGEAHVTAFLVWRGRVFGMYEHHTECLPLDAILHDLKEFRLGWLPDEVVRKAGGHGTAFAALPPEAEGFPVTYVTGRFRLVFAGHGIIDQSADPAFTGCLGLAYAVDSRQPSCTE